MFYDIIEQKKNIFATKTRSSKSRKSDIFPKGHWSFFHLFFAGNIGQENVLHDILERKKNLLGYKKKKFKKSKNWHFSKGFSPCFWSKSDPFPHFFGGEAGCNIGQKNVLYDIPEQQKNFLGHKKNLQKVQKLHFSKIFLVQNWPYFKFYSFKQYRPGTCIV